MAVPQHFNPLLMLNMKAPLYLAVHDQYIMYTV